MGFFLYNPDQKSREESIAEFVVRQNIYREVLDDLEGSSMAYPEQHFIIIGQRGMGKTTLLQRIKYGIEESKTLNRWLIPVSFPEEQYQLSELANVWEYIAGYLEDFNGFEGLSDQIRQWQYADDFEERAFDMLKSMLNKCGKKLVLLMDNLGDLFMKLELKDVYRFREILQTASEIRVIGGAIHIGGLLEYQMPFYEFFKIIRLEGLTKEETLHLIEKLAELKSEKDKIKQIIDESPGRVETLRVLTGGVPRTIAIMFGIFLDHQHEGAMDDLYRIMDLATPLYKHRMDDLPVQLQKIMDAVARHWEPISVKELAQKTRIASKTLSAQLNNLERQELVIKNDTATKNKTYLIKERFWNIWYLMRYGRKDDKMKIIWLVRFLESWSSTEELQMRIESFVEKVKKTDISEEQIRLYAGVYTSLQTLPLSSRLKLKTIEKEMRHEVEMSDDELYASAKIEFKKGNLEESVRLFLKVSDMVGRRFDLLFELTLKNALAITFENLRMDKEVNQIRLLWLYTMEELIFSDRVMGVCDGHMEMDYERQLRMLRRCLEIQMACHEMDILGKWDRVFSIFVVREAMGRFISLGFYNFILKMAEETVVLVVGKTVPFKDIWRPLYLAIRYLYEPEELEKQPHELKEHAKLIAQLLLEKIEKADHPEIKKRAPK
ncbi:ATP-binding protein [Dinghuibacter silviterrae]|uniref:Regulatory ArsR family protein n=1 Tax=Dinghuibacter silviterrae TaxID=1539049 RepID=A0A4R8DUS9_9BACT|nr:helix-turn-helix domain-containing protein [Dinghuibacter silviterrae]TDX01929.1 regulatory ArsR family protein [Dinghuibacter silviterrae]